MHQLTTNPSNASSVHAPDTLLAQLNALLEETIRQTCTDFQQICDKLATFSGKMDAGHAVSSAVRELQQVDAIRQKLQHIVDFQRGILAGESAAHGDGDEVSLRQITKSVLRLNYYQLLAAHYDYTSAVNSIQKTMQQLKLSSAAVEFEASDLSFTHVYDIQSNFKHISTTLGGLIARMSTIADFDLSRVADYFSDRYSMKSERIVLNWCISSEYDSSEDFTKYYSNHDRSESVELF